jgi:UDP-glucose/galactose:(glucosyl)LPS alpha-1,2-glucosyl/galactosyltransferase
VSSGTANVALIADRNVEPGLHVALASFLHHVSASATIRLHLFLGGFDNDALESLDTTLQPHRHRCEVKIYDLATVPSVPGKPLHGSSVPYVKLRLPHLVEHADRLLYMDADVLVLTNLLSAFKVELRGRVAAAVPGTVATAHPADRALLHAVGIPDEAAYYNTGLVLFDVPEWRERGLTDKCLDFAARWSGRLQTADQSVFNAVLHEQVAPLPERLNVAWAPGNTGPAVRGDCVLHFLGSPKPWDFGGSLVHSGRGLWTSWRDRTGLQGRRLNPLSPARLRRTMLTSRSFARALLYQLKKRPVGG